AEGAARRAQRGGRSAEGAARRAQRGGRSAEGAARRAQRGGRSAEGAARRCGRRAAVRGRGLVVRAEVLADCCQDALGLRGTEALRVLLGRERRYRLLDQGVLVFGRALHRHAQGAAAVNRALHVAVHDVAVDFVEGVRVPAGCGLVGLRRDAGDALAPRWHARAGRVGRDPLVGLVVARAAAGSEQHDRGRDRHHRPHSTYPHSDLLPSHPDHRTPNRKRRRSTGVPYRHSATVGCRESVSRTGRRPAPGWQVTWALPAGQSVTQLWNGGYTVASGTVTVTNASWNGALGAGATATFGLTGSATGAPTLPTASCATR
ncbi:cellulose-binding domain-containing protein, partial [Micromonospora sp. CPCC 205371]|nr:cellulose-binding domain-containing protein [Micromonospora sp. CPCC 205371]